MSRLLVLIIAATVLLPLAGCGDSETEELRISLEQKTLEHKECMDLNARLKDKNVALEALADITPSELDKKNNSDMEKDERILQLQYTLNRAYIDMKAALMERDRYMEQFQQAQQKIQELERKLHETPGAN